jgi:hypothetical protein
MNKDALLATIIGFIIGVAITGGILFAPKAAKYLPHFNFPKLNLANNSKPKQPSPKTTPQVKPTTFSITSPLDSSLITSDTILVSGTAPVASYVTIGGFSDENAITVGSDGKFAAKIAVGEGRNDITVTAFQNNDVASKKVTVYYTPEKF